MLQLYYLIEDQIGKNEIAIPSLLINLASFRIDLVKLSELAGS